MERQQLQRALGEVAAYVGLLERLEQSCRPSLTRPYCYWDVDDSSGLQYFQLTLYGCAALGLPAAVLNWGLGERSLRGLLRALAEGPLLGAVVGLLLGLLVLGISGFWQGREVDRMNRQVLAQNRQIECENRRLLQRYEQQRSLLEAEIQRAQGLLGRFQAQLAGEQAVPLQAEDWEALPQLEQAVLRQLEQLHPLAESRDIQQYFAQLEALDTVFFSPDK